MYRPGHFGVSLLVWAPIGAVLTWVGYPDLALVSGFWLIAAERVPDYDLRWDLVNHRGVTHTAPFGIVLGVIAGAATYVIFEIPGLLAGLEGLELPVMSGPVPVTVATTVTAAASATLGAFSHYAADVITPSGIPLLWPLRSKRYSYGFVYAKDTTANYGLLVLGTIASTPTLWLLIQ